MTQGFLPGQFSFSGIAEDIPQLPLLEPLEAREKLILAGIYTADNAPAVEVIDSLLKDIATRIEQWLGYAPAPTGYVETLRTNSDGVALTRNYPVLAVQEIAIFSDATPGYDPVVIGPDRVRGIWRQDRRIYLNNPNTPIRVTYIAGYNPLPKGFSQAALQILKQVAKTGDLSGDLSFLDEPVRDVSSLSLPGGLSKTFRLGGSGGPRGGGSKDNGATQLDRILSGLGSYRRKIIT
ncbi:MAG TPA: hypothetical protein V6C63_04555 [Allocoleopsis sp.]